MSRGHDFRFRRFDKAVGLELDKQWKSRERNRDQNSRVRAVHAADMEGKQRGSHAAQERLLAAVTYLEQNMDHPIALADVAERSGLSKHHFHRLFRSRFGLPVMHYVRRRRLAIAAERLIRSDSPILEIAIDAGFDSQAAFTRAFGRVYRITPGACRALRRDMPWLSASRITHETLAALPGLGIESPRYAAIRGLRIAGIEAMVAAGERDRHGFDRVAFHREFDGAVVEFFVATLSGRGRLRASFRWRSIKARPRRAVSALRTHASRSRASSR